ncbi:unnamed protein product [Prunus armeniaca]
MPTKSFVEIVPKCIVAFIDYHDTPKLLKMAFGIRIPFEWYEGCLPSLLRLLSPIVDHSQASQRPTLTTLALLVEGFYGVGVISQPPHWLKSVVLLGCPISVMY